MSKRHLVYATGATSAYPKNGWENAVGKREEIPTAPQSDERLWLDVISRVLRGLHSVFFF